MESLKKFLQENKTTRLILIDDGSTDGAQWLIEGHFKNKYHVVAYHSPRNSDYAKAGRFLIKLSKLRDEKIY